MKIGFVSISVPGHMLPMTALARNLRARGHDVTIFGTPAAARIVHAAQLPFVPYAADTYSLEKVKSLVEELGRLEGQAALDFTFRKIADLSRASFEHLPQAFLDADIDALVLDEVQVGLGLIPMYLRIPYVHFSCALPLDFSGKTPLFVFDWPQDNPTPKTLARNKEGLEQAMLKFELLRSVARDYAKQVGLRVDWSDPFATISKLAWLTQMPKEFDFKGADWPSQFHYAGPAHDGSGRAPANFPWDRLTGEPLIYASMGTLQNGLEHVFTTIAEAVGERPGTQLVMSIGHNLDVSQIKSLPRNAIVVNNAPQIEILKKSTLCITHAGLNTALESLTQGVPMVAIPVTNDQPGVAARIACTKTGVFVPVSVSLGGLTVHLLSTLIDEVLANPKYRQAANGMKEVIAESYGLQRAADIVEKAFGLAKKRST